MEELGTLGAIAGDVIGSVHERARTKTKDFPLLTPARRAARYGSAFSGSSRPDRRSSSRARMTGAGTA